MDISNLISSLFDQFRAGHTPRIRRDRPVKPCLYCGKPHQHNNAFCSAEHAKAWRAERKAKSAA